MTTLKLDLPQNARIVSLIFNVPTVRELYTLYHIHRHVQVNMAICMRNQISVLELVASTILWRGYWDYIIDSYTYSHCKLSITFHTLDMNESILVLKVVITNFGYESKYLSCVGRHHELKLVMVTLNLLFSSVTK